MSEVSRSQIKQYLREMNPYEFEHLVAEIWELQGYQTTVRSGSRDRGIDVEATKQTPFEEKLLIQVKRYASSNKVGSDAVRNYATLYQQVPEADTVVLVTTGGFTPQAKTLAGDLGVKIVDDDAFTDLMLEYYDNLDNFSIANGWEPQLDESMDSEPIQSPIRHRQPSITGTAEEIRKKVAEVVGTALEKEEGKATIKWFADRYDGYQQIDVLYGTKGLIFRKFGAKIIIRKPAIELSFDQMDGVDKVRTISGNDKVGKMSDDIHLYVWKETRDNIQIELDIIFEVIRQTHSSVTDITHLRFNEGKFMFSLL